MAEETHSNYGITDEIVLNVLTNDFGKSVILKSWKIEDLSSNENNGLSSLVNRVRVTYSIDGIEKVSTYISKFNPISKMKANEYYTSYIFETEAKTYTDIFPLLNEILENIGETPLKSPKISYFHLKKRQDLIILEDLCTSGFQNYDIKKGMNELQVKLVLKELAKLHAASYLMQKTTSNRELKLKYDFLNVVFLRNNGEVRKNYIDKYCQVFRDVGDYADGLKLNDVATWLRSIISEVDKYFDELYSSNDPFKVICHGDCWGGNFMFKFNNRGEAIDVRLIDLQLTREGSLVTDLSYLLYNCLDPSLKTSKQDEWLKYYHMQFNNVIQKSTTKQTFSLEELTNEYNKKIFFGMMLAFLLLPIVAEKKSVKNINDRSDSNYDILPLAGNNCLEFFKIPFVASRFHSIFNDIRRVFLTNKNEL